MLLFQRAKFGQDLVGSTHSVEAENDKIAA